MYILQKNTTYICKVSSRDEPQAYAKTIYTIYVQYIILYIHRYAYFMIIVPEITKKIHV